MASYVASPTCNENRTHKRPPLLRIMKEGLALGLDPRYFGASAGKAPCATPKPLPQRGRYHQPISRIFIASTQAPRND
ncbi:hypothetical protein GPEL0_01f3011 [Geoanaerobacter pelophilus]|uniref:Uncharacterized protein n=1 Tax=Geoanaerobacter pelophilus TaxID=60036 RepID=A0ABQ0MJV8_9BACT|nr:hypothetical protein GPEL0_01f3011 [Geoanaerobacter pelophilus]